MSGCCDLLENIYLCGINNNWSCSGSCCRRSCDLLENIYLCGINNNCFFASLCEVWLWFAWKYLPLWYQQQQTKRNHGSGVVVICLKISTFVVSTTTFCTSKREATRCDLLENIYLCGINNNFIFKQTDTSGVVICLKISTFVVSTTT